MGKGLVSEVAVVFTLWELFLSGITFIP